MSPLIPAAFQEEEKPAERRTKVKICGLSRTEDIFYVNEACPGFQVMDITIFVCPLGHNNTVIAFSIN